MTMNLIIDLFTKESIPQAFLVLSVVIAFGIALGSCRIRGIGLGISAVLFVGLLGGHCGLHVHPGTLQFARDAGLVLFVYAIGLQAGPGFVNSMRQNGIRLNVLAVLAVTSGLLVTFAWLAAGSIPRPLLIGLYTGAVTNTPSLAAAQQLLGLETNSSSIIEQTTVGYAIAYPGGVFGIIGLMILSNYFLRDEKARLGKADLPPLPLASMSVKVTAQNWEGSSLNHLLDAFGKRITISRHFTGGSIQLACPTNIVQDGDILLAVGTPQEVESFCRFAGQASEVDLRTLPSNLSVWHIQVNRRQVLPLALSSLVAGLPGIVTTRIRRGNLELSPSPDLHLKIGDVLQVVGEKSELEKASLVLGSALHELDHPQLVTMIVGVILGVILGSIPISIPGLSIPITLGLAGGPLLAALVLGHIGRIGPLIWQLPPSANFLLRELGIGVFLACVGLKSGAHVVESLLAGNGLLWFFAGLSITILPLSLLILAARLLLRCKLPTILGLLAGSMTDPPALSFAASLDDGNEANVSYATVYPLAMLLRVIGVQVFVVLAANYPG